MDALGIVVVDVLREQAFQVLLTKFRTGHYDGKGRIAEWILWQNQETKDRMGAAVFTTGPYMEMTISAMTPMTPSVEDGVVTWRVPLGDGAVPHVALEDCGYYARWLFDNAERAKGMNLELAIEQVRYQQLAAAFEKVTGRPAKYIDTELEACWSGGPLSMAAEAPAGYNADPADKSAMSVRDNFTGFWSTWKYEIVQRDNAFLDEIHPNRIKSVDEWLRREDQLGRELGKGGLWERVQPENLYSVPPLLELTEDQGKGRL